jgi:hypothetical protein
VKLRIDRTTPFLHRGTQALPVRRVAIEAATSNAAARHNGLHPPNEMKMGRPADVETEPNSNL